MQRGGKQEQVPKKTERHAQREKETGDRGTAVRKGRKSEAGLQQVAVGVVGVGVFVGQSQL